MSTLADNTDNLDSIKIKLQSKPWLVACLCAAWCDTCQVYRKQFDALASKHPDKCFAWIDIEDQAELVDALDIENFPTILIEYQDDVLFFGTMLPDATQVDRLLHSFIASLADNGSQQAIAKSNSLIRDIPQGWNLRRLILENKHS
ncbi:MAG: thioredoxin family protein [Undibacterium sp.]|nr:thioredoxin family protein [Undibacterium sp.]